MFETNMNIVSGTSLSSEGKKKQTKRIYLNRAPKPSRSALKSLVSKREFDDMFSIWNTNKDEVVQFIKQADNHQPTITFTAVYWAGVCMKQLSFNCLHLNSTSLLGNEVCIYSAADGSVQSYIIDF